MLGMVFVNEDRARDSLDGRRIIGGGEVVPGTCCQGGGGSMGACSRATSAA